ncbi:MAG: hypothetical protein Q7S28_02205 [bacterium]|nr:hypothetical protein [bacterium]
MLENIFGKTHDPPMVRGEKIILAVFLCVIFAYSFNQIYDSDSFYHLKAGQVIAETKSIPHTDIFSSTAFGAPWVTHEWLAEVVFYFVYQLGGFWFLIGFVALIAALTYFIIFQTARLYGIYSYVAIPLLFVFAYANSARWAPRPQVFSFLFLASVIYCLEKYRRGGHIRFLYAVVAIIILWANMHASVILGLGILEGYAILEMCKRWWPQWLGIQMVRPKKIFYAVGAAWTLALLNPNTYKIFFYSDAIQEGIKNFNVLEWKSILTFIGNTRINVLVGELVLGVIILVWWFGVRKASRDVTPLAMGLLISAMPFSSARHIGLWPIVVLASILVPLSYVGERALRSFDERRIWYCVLALGGLFLASRIYYVPTKPVDAALLPVHAMDFIVENNLKGPLFNLYNEGGYLIWRMYPDEKVFIDGRSEVFPGEPTRDFLNIIGNGPEWDTLVNEKYGLNYFILDYAQSAQYRSINKLVARLIIDQWPLVYWDDRYIIFVRRSEANRDIIERYAMRHINPFRPAESIPAEEALAAEAELDRSLKYFDAHDITANTVLDYAWRFEKNQMAQ